MKKIIIRGGNKLNGNIHIEGMKNAALPIIFASVLVGEKCFIENIPDVNDINISLEILRNIGADIKFPKKNCIEIDTSNVVPCSSPYDLVSKMRGSTYLLGAELGRFGVSKVGWPGGCDFGTRPIDQHIKGFEALGATVVAEGGYINASVVKNETDSGEIYSKNGLHGARVFLDVASVGATINVILAATLADGVTVIENAAREPHIVDLAGFLNTCGADIMGAGTSVIKIRGVDKLHGCQYKIIPDMIEAGTYMAAVAATGGCVSIQSVIPKHLETITAKLREMGVSVTEYEDSITVESDGNLKPVTVKTLPYPGFPTDMHPQFTVLLCLADGVGQITENVWDNRYRYVDELHMMGAVISVDGRTATVVGNGHLKGAPVKSVDLRAGAALVIAGLAADGVTEISKTETIERGYHNLVGKLRLLGADISKMQ